MAFSFLAERASAKSSTSVSTPSVSGSAGELMIVGFSLRAANNSATNDIQSISDTGGNTWTKLGGAAATPNVQGSAIWYSVLVASPGTVTISGGSLLAYSYKFEAFSGGNASPGDISQSNSGGSDTSATTASATPASGSELAVAVFALRNRQASFTPDAAYTQAGTTLNLDSDIAFEYLLAAPSGAQTTTGGWPSTSLWSTTFGFFKPYVPPPPRAPIVSKEARNRSYWW